MVENEVIEEPKHSLIDDIQAVVFGVSMASFGIYILTCLGFITGQTAGLAILISYATGWSFGPVFFVVNIPFYWLGYSRFGFQFVFRTFISVLLLSILTTYFPLVLTFDYLEPLTGAVLFGFATGVGLLALFRHGGSLGGIGILALFIQDKTGFKAGYTQLLFDIVLFGIALLLHEFSIVFYSFIGAVVLNLVVAINHSEDRYIAT